MQARNALFHLQLLPDTVRLAEQPNSHMRSTFLQPTKGLLNPQSDLSLYSRVSNNSRKHSLPRDPPPPTRHHQLILVLSPHPNLKSLCCTDAAGNAGLLGY